VHQFADQDDLQHCMSTGDSNTRGTKAQIGIGLDERVKAVSRSRLEILEILNDRFGRCGSKPIETLIHAEVASVLFLPRVSY
jgi:hypothetical protein